MNPRASMIVSVFFGMSLIVSCVGCVNVRADAVKTFEAQLANRNATRGKSADLHAKAVDAYERNRLEDAVEAAEAAVKGDHQNALAWMLIGTVRFEQKRLFEAVKAFEQAARLQPMRHEARFNMGVVLEQAGRYDAAIEEYELALSRAPADIHINENLARCYIKAGRDPKRAKQLIEKSLNTERRPEWIEWLRGQLAAIDES